MLNSVYNLLPDELSAILNAHFPKYRSKQLLVWLYQRFENDPAKMSNLPTDFKAYLNENFSFALPVLDARYVSKDGAIKFRHRLEDDAVVESVLIPEGRKNTLCISSQVGCARKCSFCATGKMGLTRNLTTAEIIGQIIMAYRECVTTAPLAEPDNTPKPGQHTEMNKISNLVFMGMGEPFDNYDNVLQTLRIIQADDSLAFSPRRTTVSTCGVVPGIIDFADSGVKAKLAISLNSAIDEKRSSMMPINRKYSTSELKQALLYYLRKVKFRVTVEYILIPEVNMAREDLNALRKFVGDISCKINFIPYNPGPGSALQAPTTQQTEEFMQAAKSLPQAITLRKSRGADVFGACGQLYKAKAENKAK
ncbi:MAG: 23S rRNA (adenine(2503)-C(2))-methyltransferase RlmN [Candidatus Cloacimonas sp.]|jgi:23S rRNA (adenine2503-C2)-methyltransferase|nr:23S rRNA (adenine(2503)-C(2))-methyltransferase RlmN [Candidatus Cloacimonas sp.]